VEAASNALRVPDHKAQENCDLRQVQHQHGHSCECAERLDSKEWWPCSDKESNAICQGRYCNRWSSMNHSSTDALSSWQAVWLLVDGVADYKHIVNTDTKHHWRQNLWNFAGQPPVRKTDAIATRKSCQHADDSKERQDQTTVYRTGWAKEDRQVDADRDDRNDDELDISQDWGCHYLKPVSILGQHDDVLGLSVELDDCLV